MELYDDVVLSTRIRLARNIEGFKFPNIMIDREQKELLKRIKEKISGKYTILELDNVDDITKGSLVETHKISKELLNKGNTALIIDEKNDITTMINEEDHLRIQAFSKGFNIDNIYYKIKDFDSFISGNIDYSYDNYYGYLTACPTCIGTGMRVSVMLHLPCLGKIGALEKTLNELSNLGVSVRGIYGENTEGEGYIYQISNQKTLGLREKDIIEQIKQVTKYIVKQERRAREVLKSRIDIKDDIYRSYGTLKYSYKISKGEAMDLLSNIRMGINMGELTDISIDTVEKITKNIGKNALKLEFKEDFSNEEEEIKRSQYIRREMV